MGKSNCRNWQEIHKFPAASANVPFFKGKSEESPSPTDVTESTPEWIRTTDLRFRKPSLYPAELREQTLFIQEVMAKMPFSIFGNWLR